MPLNYPSGTVCFSVGPYNTTAHLDAALKIIAELAANRCASAKASSCRAVGARGYYAPAQGVHRPNLGGPRRRDQEDLSDGR